MFALMSGFRRGGGGKSAPLPHDINAGDGIVASEDRHRRVLPRFLRRPARMAGRLLSEETSLPGYASTIASATLIGAAVIYGILLGGHGPAVAQAVTSRAGFAVDEIKISGHREISEIDIVGALGLDGWTSMLGYSADEARQRVASLAWVERVSVRKSYPSTLEIDIVERSPFAIWQNGSTLSLVEADGDVITAYPGRQFARLPLIVGFGAPEHAASFIGEIGTQSELAGLVKAYIRVADRRWDLRLKNGITVKLPEKGARDAVADLIALDKTEGLLSRDVTTIDMRLADRLIVRLTPEAVVKREAAIKEGAKRAARRNDI